MTEDTSPRPWSLDEEVRTESPQPRIRDAHGRVVAMTFTVDDGRLIVKAVNVEEQFLPTTLRLRSELADICRWLTNLGFGGSRRVQRARRLLLSEEVQALGRREISG